MKTGKHSICTCPNDKLDLGGDIFLLCFVFAAYPNELVYSYVSFHFSL